MGRIKWDFVIPMVLMCIVGLGVLIATFGQVVYGSLFYTKVKASLYVSYAGTTLGNMTLGLVLFMILGLVFMILSIFTDQVLALMGCALGSQLVGGVLSILVALNTAPESRARHFAAMEANYTKLDTADFERQYSCSGLRSNGCITGCCDEALEAWLSEIYTIFQFSFDQNPPFLLLFSLLWFTMMAILLPSVVAMVSKRRETEKSFKKGW